jgi:hypothetical protein
VSIRRVAPTIARAMGVRAPDICTARPVASRRVERVFVFAVDSVPRRLLTRLPKTRALLGSPRVVSAVYPPVTPVCFASMFTGAPPRAHGIVRYSKPVLACETVFDTLAEAGRRVAIVSVARQSMDRIFRKRPIDYFSERYDPQVVSRALALIAADRHDVIVAYNQAYDDADHATHPTSARALRALALYDASAARLVAACGRHWSAHPRLFVWATDHGCHVEDGRGTHGRRIPQDMRVPLFVRYDP